MPTAESAFAEPHWNCGSNLPEGRAADFLGLAAVGPFQSTRHDVSSFDARISLSKVVVIDPTIEHAASVVSMLSEIVNRNPVVFSDSGSVLRRLEEARPDLIILDYDLPNDEGLRVVFEVATDPILGSVPIILYSENMEHEARLAAIGFGVNDFLVKPVDRFELVARARCALRLRGQRQHLEMQAAYLENVVQERMAELITSRFEVVHCLGRAAEYRDNETGRHVIRVGKYTRLISEKLGLPKEMVDLFELAAPLHDVGKIGVPDAILRKPAKLTAEEYAEIQKHCQFGYEILANLPRNDSTSTDGQGIAEGNTKSPVLRLAASIAMTHHEKWDGTGYPRGLKGVEIPLEGRIVAVADVFDALTSARPYKRAFSIEESLAILERDRGTHFDPRLVDIFLESREEVAAILLDSADES